MSYEDYKKAQKQGVRAYHEKLLKGEYPFLPCLGEILPEGEILKEVKLGLEQIPMEQIAGTYTAGRQNAFAPNYMPLLEADTEFAMKWSLLCDAHLKEGIHDSVTAYEYMNHYYILEGNKRVSVLRFFEAVTVPAVVTRIIPKKTDEKENKIYYEFMDFYELSEVNYLNFSQEGRFKEIQKMLGMEENHVWTDEEKEIFYAFYYRFKNEYEAKGGKKLPITVGDALLPYLKIYGYKESQDKLPAEIREDLGKIWSEFEILKDDQPLEHVMEPNDAPVQKSLISKILPASAPKKIKIAFVNDKTAQTSSWTYAHELGRMYLEEKMGGQIETKVYNNAKDDGEDGLSVVEQAIADDNKVIFTTTPQLVKASLRAAVNHPEVKILNCSLNISHSIIRTYYARLYEAKILTGIIAGALSDDNQIGYIADYPIFGMIANINAFAFGASLSNPRAKIHLEWSTKIGSDPVAKFRDKGISIVSGHDMIRPQFASREFGVFQMNGEDFKNVATSVTDWGKMYELIVKSIISGSFTKENVIDGKRALNYWWGLTAGAVDVICSAKLPAGTRRLIEIVRKSIVNDELYPFEGELVSNDGKIIQTEGRLSPDHVVSMNWLAENVVGEIPDIEDLVTDARAIVELQGMMA